MLSSLKTGALSFEKILSFISRTLNVANQLVPIYTKAKPLMQNSKNILSGFKEIYLNNDKNKVEKKENKENKKTELRSNNPVFFA